LLSRGEPGGLQGSRGKELRLRFRPEAALDHVAAIS
jgi:hypothetical protein